MTARKDANAKRRTAQRKILISRWGPVCWICKARGVSRKLRRIDLELSGLDPMGFSRDHVIPLCKGGSNKLANLRPAHRCCNMRRAGINVATPWSPDADLGQHQGVG